MGLFSRRRSVRHTARGGERDRNDEAEPAYLDWIDIYTLPRDESSTVPKTTWVLRDPSVARRVS